MIGVDSNILVFAGVVPKKREFTSDEQEFAWRCRLLFELHLNDLIFVPTISLSEVLIPVAESKRGKLIAELQERFAFADFNPKSAAIAAELWKRRHLK